MGFKGEKQSGDPVPNGEGLKDRFWLVHEALIKLFSEDNEKIQLNINRDGGDDQAQGFDGDFQGVINNIVFSIKFKGARYPVEQWFEKSSDGRWQSVRESGGNIEIDGLFIPQDRKKGLLNWSTEARLDKVKRTEAYWSQVDFGTAKLDQVAINGEVYDIPKSGDNVVVMPGGEIKYERYRKF